MKPADILGLRSASDAQPSPDGGRIACVVTELDRAMDQARSSIWLFPISGGPPQRLAQGSQPRWSPDGQTLAFISSSEHGPQIWLLHVATGAQPMRSDGDIQHSPLAEATAIARDAGTQPLRHGGDTHEGQLAEGSAIARDAVIQPMRHGGDTQEGQRAEGTAIARDAGTQQGRLAEPSLPIARDAGTQHGQRAEGSLPVPLTDVPGGVTGPPVWSPDGRRIAFTSRVSTGTAGAPRVIRRLRYLLNGDGYIGDGFWHVFTVSTDGADPVQLTRGDWHHFAPAWSPDGDQITCITTRRDDWDTEWVWDVYVLDPELRCLTDSQGVCAAPAWSPDGQWIAYYANECPGTAYTQDYYLWLVPTGGGPARSVSKVLDRGCQVSQPPSANEPPRWSPDSKTISIHVREGGFYHYYAYHLADESLRRVLAPNDVQEPIAGLVRQSRDGQLLALAAASAVQPAELYTYVGGYHQLSHLNRDALASFKVRAPERLSHTSPEGWPVETWLWLPPSHRPGDPPLPAVLYYHGGPHNSVALGFNEQLHVLAGAGFAVVAVDFRGSTGFGAAFADSILGDWGPRELADGLTIVDLLVAQGVVDARRLGVYGGSYGGFMTNLALARTDRFAAGVSYATISGLDSWSYVTDHWESVDWDSGGAPWQIPDYYRTHSPLTYVADIHAPLLILHGEEDLRCSVAEADQLFGALRKLKRTVELVRYPGGSHAFSHIGPPSHRLDALQRTVDWFLRYL